MKLLAAYLLLVLGGNAAPTADDITNVITSVGGEVDEEKLATLLADVDGKDLNELIAKGKESLKSVSVGGGGGGAAGMSRDNFHYICHIKLLLVLILF